MPVVKGSLRPYNDKNNEVIGEDNADGESHNRSWNHGVERPTDDAEVHALRERQKRSVGHARLLIRQLQQADLDGRAHRVPEIGSIGWRRLARWCAEKLGAWVSFAAGWLPPAG